MKNFLGSLRILPRWTIIVLDLLALIFSSFMAYVLRFNFEWTTIFNSNIEAGMLAYVFWGMAAIFLTKSYTGIVRYTSFQDTIRILYTALLGFGLTMVFNFFYRLLEGHSVIPFSIIIIGYVFTFIFWFAYRTAVKSAFAYVLSGKSKRRNVLIFGAGHSGQIAKQVLDHNNRSGHKVVGFLDDDPNKVGKKINDINIYSGSCDLMALFERLEVEELIFTIHDLPVERKNELVDMALRADVHVKTVPPAKDWIKGELSVKQIKEIRIEDLLGRETIELDNDSVIQEIKNKTILISGAAGSIGSEILRQVLHFSPYQIILVDQAESQLYDVENEVAEIKPEADILPIVADITNRNRLESIFRDYRPDIVYHAAAYKHVPLMEKNPREAVMCNIIGTKNMADLSHEYHVSKFVMVSTDKAVRPTSVMGASKRIAEMYVQSFNSRLHESNMEATRFVTTRFGNVLGSNGSVIPLFKRQISQGGPITLTHPDITRYFMTIPEACRLVLEAGAMGLGGEIFIFDMGKAIKIMDLAKKMIRLSGLVEGRDIEIRVTGLREGEKLYEELLNDKENTILTHHPKIMIAKVSFHNYEKVNRLIMNLEDLIKQESDDFELVKGMKAIVPDYKSHVSRYQILD